MFLKLSAKICKYFHFSVYRENMSLYISDLVERPR